MELQNRKAVSGQTLHLLRVMQQNEADEAEIYRRIAACAKDRENRDVLLRLAEAEQAHAAKWKEYTGVTYLVAVALLILPYLLLSPRHYLPALGLMLAIVVLIPVIFNYYIAVAKDMPFGKRFGQMACISLGVAALSFLAGLFMKNVMNVNL